MIDLLISLKKIIRNDYYRHRSQTVIKFFAKETTIVVINFQKKPKKTGSIKHVCQYTLKIGLFE